MRYIYNGGWNAEPAGSSQATALTSGMIAYYMGIPQLQAQFVDGGVEKTSENVKTVPHQHRYSAEGRYEQQRRHSAPRHRQRASM